jgi:hypothetical protein
MPGRSAGHPRIDRVEVGEDVDGRDEPGHDKVMGADFLMRYRFAT